MSQSTSSSNEVNISEWDRAIVDAQELLYKVEEKASRLRSAIRTFKESKAAGEPYVAQSSDQSQEQQHSV